MVEADILRRISFLLVTAAYSVFFNSMFAAAGHVLEGLIIFTLCNIFAVVLFAVTGFENLTLTNYITVMGGLFGILIGFYTLYTMEGSTVFS